MQAAGSFKIADRLLVAVGLLTVGYHVVMVHWQLQDSTYHYITHVFLVMAVAALAAIADALEDLRGWRARTKLGARARGARGQHLFDDVPAL